MKKQFFATGSDYAETKARKARLLDLENVTYGWVNPVERGSGIFHDVIPDGTFTNTIILFGPHCPCSTQLAVHFAEVQHRVKSEKGTLLALFEIDLDAVHVQSEIAGLAPYQLVQWGSILSLIKGSRLQRRS